MNRDEVERHNSVIDGSEVFEDGDDITMESTAFPLDQSFIQWLSTSNSPPAAVRHFRTNRSSAQHEMYQSGGPYG
jgi:hypothetical protein